ncbi:hypothetical protein ACYU03_15335 [Pseudomonas sp. X10]
MEDISPRAIEKLEAEVNERLSEIFTPDQIEAIKDLIRLEVMKRESEHFNETEN